MRQDISLQEPIVTTIPALFTTIYICERQLAWGRQRKEKIPTELSHVKQLFNLNGTLFQGAKIRTKHSMLREISLVTSLNGLRDSYSKYYAAPADRIVPLVKAVDCKTTSEEEKTSS